MLAFVKPGAELSNELSSTNSPPGGCTVIVAGTNDPAVREQMNVGQHLSNTSPPNRVQRGWGFQL